MDKTKKLLLIAYPIACLPAVYFSANHYVTYHGKYGRFNGYTSILVLSLFTYCIYDWFEKKEYELLEKILIFIAIIAGATSIVEVLNTTNFYKSIGWTGNSNVNGNLLALLLPFVLLKKHWVGIILTMAGLALSQSRSAIFASIIILIFWVIKNKWCRIFIVATMISLIISIRFLPNDNKITNMFNYENTYRGKVLVESLDLVSFWGIGNDLRTRYGMIEKPFDNYPNLSNSNVLYDDLHNVLPNHLIKWGVLATLIYITLLLFCLKSDNRAVRYSIFSYFVFGFGTFDMTVTSIILWPIIAYGLFKEID